MRLERFLDLYSQWTWEQEGGGVLRPLVGRGGGAVGQGTG